MLTTIDRRNNFDLIRLLAALQVLLWHGAAHLHINTQIQGLMDVLFHFQGVPVFFTISGFLISYSWQRSRGQLRGYIRNRMLRIYPALWVCTIFTVILLGYFGKISSGADVAKWLLAQLTFFQFYVSDSLRAWGVGHPNGSLWSIAVELQFYVLLPLILWVMQRLGRRLYQALWLLGLFGFSLWFKNSFEPSLVASPMVQKLAGVTVFHSLHFFVTGILIFLFFDKLKKILEEKALWWLAGYVLYVALFSETYGINWYQNPYDTSLGGLLANTLLSLMTISLAFSFKNTSEKLLHGQDISYGLYIYHMPLVNVWLSIGWSGALWHWLLLIGTSVGLAWASWHWVEAKALRYK
jgi:peptidoglycan/LPS O-acetylase OafA/YrhL